MCIRDSQEAKVVQADPKASEEDVLKSWTNLVKWIHALGMRSGDKTLLLQVITAAGTYNLDNYVDAGKEEFQEALQEAQKVYEDEFAGQDTVDIATDRLMNAILELRLKANKSNLDALLKSAKKIDLTQYTRSTANAVSYTHLLIHSKILLTSEKSGKEPGARRFRRTHNLVSP